MIAIRKTIIMIMVRITIKIYFDNEINSKSIVKIIKMMILITSVFRNIILKAVKIISEVMKILTKLIVVVKPKSIVVVKTNNQKTITKIIRIIRIGLFTIAIKL